MLTKKYIFLSFLAVVFFLPAVSHASLITSQSLDDLNSTTITGAGGNVVARQDVWYTGTYTIRSIVVYPASNSTMTNCNQISMATASLSSFSVFDSFSASSTPVVAGTTACVYRNYSGTAVAPADGGITVILNSTGDPNSGYLFLGTNSVASTTYGTINVSTGARTNAQGGVKALKYFLYDSATDAPPPVGDGSSATHVIRVNSPALYATTTSPVSVSFDYEEGTPIPANGYFMTFVQALTRTTVRTPVSYFSGGGDSGEFSETSSSVSLPESGDWRLTITLVDGSPDDPTAPVSNISVSPVHVFGIGYHDNTTTIVDTSPASIVGFASSSCAILSGSFNLGDCVGFLVIGDASSYSVASSSPASFGSLTLADRFPFAYAYDIGTFRQELFSDSGANASTSISVSVPNFGTITFLSQSMIASVPFAPTIKTILGWLMWLMTIEVIYLTVIRSHNTNTGV